MAARVEDRVEVVLPDTVEANGFVELSLRGGVLLKPERKVVRNSGKLLAGSSGGRPPFGDASVMSTPASLKV